MEFGFNDRPSDDRARFAESLTSNCTSDGVPGGLPDVRPRGNASLPLTARVVRSSMELLSRDHLPPATVGNEVVTDVEASRRPHRSLDRSGSTVASALLTIFQFPSKKAIT